MKTELEIQLVINLNITCETAHTKYTNR